MNDWEEFGETDIDVDATGTNESTKEIDFDMCLEGKTIDELQELRNILTGQDISVYKDLSESEENIREEDIEWTPGISEIDEKTHSSFHWDGLPTHNVDWDEDTEPTERVLVKRKTR